MDPAYNGAAKKAEAVLRKENLANLAKQLEASTREIAAMAAVEELKASIARGRISDLVKKVDELQLEVNELRSKTTVASGLSYDDTFLAEYECFAMAEIDRDPQLLDMSNRECDRVLWERFENTKRSMP